MKKTVAALMLSVLALALSGCIFTAPEATLYRLPKLAGEYESLEARIDTLLAMGGEYAAPTSGSNLQSVQMIDLDSDGVEEAVEEKLGEKVWRVEGKQSVVRAPEDVEQPVAGRRETVRRSVTRA